MYKISFGPGESLAGSLVWGDHNLCCAHHLGAETNTIIHFILLSVALASLVQCTGRSCDTDPLLPRWRLYMLPTSISFFRT